METKINAALRALYLQAMSAQEADDHPAMLFVADQILARNPGDPLGLMIAGAAFLREKRFGLAAQLLGSASAARPDDAELWNNFGCALQEWHPKDALGCLEKAMQLDPELDAPVQNVISTLSSLGRFGDALIVAEDYLQRNPNDPDANHNAGLAYMQQGQWAKAFACWKREAEDPGRSSTQRFYDAPVWPWDGQARREFGDDQVQNHVVIYGQQGVGDEILAASVYDKAIASDASITIECEPRLEGLLRRSFPGARVEGTLLDDGPDWVGGAELTHKIGAIDCMGLYALAPFRRGRYLETDPGLVAMFREYLASLGTGLKVGIAWTGGKWDWDRAQRCIAPDVLKPLLSSPGVQFVSLQYEAGDAPEGVHDIPWATRKGVDLDLTAALIDALDLVISVPQTCVDIAGALGAPCWALTPPVPQWRFSEMAGDTAWIYSSVDIIRRQGPFWSGAVAMAAQRLRLMVEQGRNPRTEAAA